MKIGVHLPRFTYEGGPVALGGDLARIAAALDAAGVDRISVMDHVWQIGPHGPVEHDMLEAYTTLGYIAAHTSRAQLLTLVTGVTYRDPGLLVKAVTTLDVLSGGRAMFGIGAAWNEEESRGLGLFFPPRKERFERLEETLQIALQMWAGDESPYKGQHYQLERPLNSPQSLRRPHPPILIGGGGEQKTLRFVARYAQACNLFDGPDLEHKLEVLKQRCEEEGRDYDDVEKTVSHPFEIGADGSGVDELLTDLRRLRDLGVDVVHGRVERVQDITPIQVLGEKVVTEVAGW